MLKITAMSLALLLGLIVLVVVIGYALPQQHVAARAISLRQKPSRRICTDFELQGWILLASGLAAG
jgi:uncharacterized membrane protein YqgA involved in biofilm formation